MNIEALKGLTEEDLRSDVINWDVFSEHYLTYTGTNEKRANIFLSEVLNNEERDYLLKLLHDNRGWYRARLGEYTDRCRIVANHLGFCNDFFHYDRNKEYEIADLAERIGDNELALLKSSYIKQKLVTYKTLLNMECDKIELYRGIKTLDSSDRYKHYGLESWTRNILTAKSFAGRTGFILAKSYHPIDIFVCRRTVFKTDEIPPVEYRKNINLYDEFVVENRDEDMLIVDGLNLFRGGV